MKKICLGFLISLLSINIHAQVVNFEWVKSMGGTLEDEARSITTDAFGNVYTCGTFEGIADFDPSPNIFNLTSNGLRDIFIQKLDANGNFEWAKSIGGIGLDDAYSIAIDVSGNAYITGKFDEIVDFDPNAGVFNFNAMTGFDAFILKLDSLGNFIWATSMQGILNVVGNSIIIDASENVYVTGYFSRTVDFDPGVDTFNLVANGFSNEAFIQKLDANGDFIWAKSITGTGSNSSGSAITIDASGNLCVAGYFTSTADFDPGVDTFNLTSSGGTNNFILKLDTDGNFIWAKGIGASSGNSIITDALGNIYVGGSFFGTADFDPSVATFNLTSNGIADVFLLKLDVNGNFVWAKSMGGSSLDFGGFVATDASGSLYATGTYRGTVDFDPGIDTFNLIANGNWDAFIQKLDANGNFIWAKSIGGAFIDYGNAITLNPCGTIYVTGKYSSIVDFDISADTFNLTSNGSNDVYVLKLSQLDTVSVPNDTTYCPGDIIPASIFKSNFADGTFIWTNSNSDIGLAASDTGNTPVFIATNTTTSPITATITVNVCMGPLSNYTITVNPTPIIDAGTDVTIQLGENTTLNATGTNGNYTWSPSDGLSCITCTGPISTPEESITYTVEVVDASGCTASDSITVTIELENLIFVPNIFSPNEDGFNDILYIRGQDIESFQFVIYDRWGNKVFESTSLTTGWDGLFRGKKMNKSVFVYHLKGIFKNGSEFNKKGNISLIK